MAAAKASNSSTSIDASLLKAMTEAFTKSALPGENDGFDAQACQDAARFILQLSHMRKSGQPALALESYTDSSGRLAMRIAMNNDDMPFLVDSISAAIAAKGIAVKIPLPLGAQFAQQLGTELEGLVDKELIANGFISSSFSISPSSVCSLFIT